MTSPARERPSREQDVEDRETTWQGELPSVTRWSGRVVLTGDAVVPAGGVLHIEPGTRVLFRSKPQSKFGVNGTGPRGRPLGFADGKTALVVSGRLEAAGTPDSPIFFESGPGGWGGLLFVKKGRGYLKFASLRRAGEGAIRCFDRSRVAISFCDLTHNDAGVMASGLSQVAVLESSFEKNGTGLGLYDFACGRVERCRFRQNRNGIWLDDAAHVWSDRNEIRENQDYGLIGEGRSRSEIRENVWEGHPRCAIFLRDDALLRSFKNRLFQNGIGMQFQGRASLSSRADIVGPNEREGIHVEDRSRIDLMTAFIHSHTGSAGVYAQGMSRVKSVKCRYVRNRVGVGGIGQADLTLRSCIFDAQTQEAAVVSHWARLDAEDCLFTRNDVGVAFHGISSGALRRCVLRENRSAAVRMTAESRAVMTGNRCAENGTGLDMSDSSRGQMKHGILSSHREHGVLLRHQADVTVIETEIRESALSGAQLMDRSTGCFLKNRFYSNEIGLSFLDLSAGVVGENLLRLNRKEGVSCSTSGEVELRGNRIERNSVGVGHFKGNAARVMKNIFYEQGEGAGLCTETASPRWERNRVENNVRGILCRDQSRPFIRRNRFIENRLCGIDRSVSSRPVIEDNDFLQNKSAWVQDEQKADGNNVA